MGQKTRVIKHTTPARFWSYIFFCVKPSPLKEVIDFAPDFSRNLLFCSVFVWCFLPVFADRTYRDTMR